MNLNERTLDMWYLAAILGAIPGLIAWLRVSIWWAPLLTVAALVGIIAAVLGFLNRRRKLDALAAAGLLVYATVLAALSVVGWIFLWVAVSE